MGYFRVGDNQTGRPQRSLFVSPLKRNAARFRDKALTFFAAMTCRRLNRL